ncbi:MAG: CapA family protein [Candidatus Aminicenantes bacterium]|nr:CapA family protein [Candidatus Aminicenantes bacterium]
MKSQLPVYARDMMSALPWWKRLHCRLMFLLADTFRFWRRPKKMNPDPVNWPKGPLPPYWFYKSKKHILLPEKGSDLDSHFKSYQDRNGPFTPKGFREEKRMRLSAVGDLMNAKGMKHSGGKFYAHVSDLIFGADISIANLESTLTSYPVQETVFSAEETPKINATPEEYNALKGHEGRQYTIFHTANNHILDCGKEGFDTTHDVIEAEGFLFVGTNRTPEEQKKGRLVISNGIKFGFVAATYGLNSRPFPEGKKWLVNHVPFHKLGGKTDLSLLEEQINWCRSEQCDAIVVSLHWGLEFELYPWKEQLEIAHALVEAGADAILSHHTHNIQPYELYQTRRDPDRIAPILYGLGNLASIMSSPFNALSLIANLEFVKGQNNDTKKTFVKDVRITPVIQIEKKQEDGFFLQIQPLKDLLADPGDITDTAYLNKAAHYADLALGAGWRS